MKYVGVCRGVSLDIYYIVTVPYRITVPSIVVARSGDYRWLWQSQPSRHALHHRLSSDANTASQLRAMRSAWPVAAM